MTPLRSALVTLVAAIAMTVGAVTAVGDSPPPRAQACTGWTAYAPLDEEPGDGVTPVDAVDIVFDCPGTDVFRPERWPPGAQPPPGWHDEIQIIR